MARSKRFVKTVEWWRSVMDEFGSSGQTIRAFCRRKEIPEGTFFAWRKRLSKSDGRAAGSGPGGKPMIPVEVVMEERGPYAHNSSATNGSLEIVTPGGCRLRFDRSLEPSYLCNVLQSVLRVESEVSSC